MRYVPDWFVCPSYRTLVLLLIALTVACGSTALEGSATWPVIVALVDCPRSRLGIISRTAQSANIRQWLGTGTPQFLTVNFLTVISYAVNVFGGDDTPVPVQKVFIFGSVPDANPEHSKRTASTRVNWRCEEAEVLRISLQIRDDLEVRYEDTRAGTVYWSASCFLPSVPQ